MSSERLGVAVPRPSESARVSLPLPSWEARLAAIRPAACCAGASECWPAPSGTPCCRNAGDACSTSQAAPRSESMCTGPGYHDQGEESERVLTVDTSFRATAGGPARGPECEGAGRVGAHPHRRPAPHTPNTAGPGAGPGHTDCACGASSQHMGIATCRWGRVSRSPGLHGQAVAQACPASQPLSDCPTATRRRSKQVRALRHPNTIAKPR